MQIVCPNCEEAGLYWVDPDVTSLDSDLKCCECGEVYSGMGDYQRQCERKEAREQDPPELPV